MRLLLRSILCLSLLAACRPDSRSLCERFYAPYPDHLSNRASTPRNRLLVAAMVPYNKGEYAKAAEQLRAIIDMDPTDLNARIYLVSALLGAGDAYKAEMHLDYLENAHNQNYSDQVDWYNDLCSLCTGDTAKALQQAQWIASRPVHTYHDAAVALASTLSEK